MNKSDIALAALTTLLAGEGRSKAEAAPTNPAELGARLRELQAAFSAERDFAVGDLVVQKPGLSMDKYPEEGRVALVTAFLDDPIIVREHVDGIEDFGSPQMSVVIDTEIAVIVDGLFLHYLIDGRRLKKAAA